MQDRFSDENRHARHLLCLVLSIIVNKALKLNDEEEDMLFWEKNIPFLKSLGNEVRGWKTLWQSTDRELPNNLLAFVMKMLFQASVAFWSLPVPYRSQEQKLGDRFHFTVNSL